jgi:ABC-type transport system involved in multi-copper enzyme maturation permease subunit
VSIFLPDYSLPPPALLPRSQRLWAILTAEIRARARAINIVFLAMIYLVVVVPIVLEFYLASLLGGFLPGGAPITIFYTPFGLGVWDFFLVLLTSSVGAAIIAGDMATRAITMYLARPISHADYLAAKLGAVGFWVALGAIAPGTVGTIVVLALGYVSLPIALTAFGGFLGVGLLATVALTGLATMLSAFSSRSAFAGAGIFGTLVGAEAVAAVLSAIGRNNGFLYVSPLQDGNAVAMALFGLTGDPLDPWAAAGVLLGLGATTIALAYLRLQRTEVVSE